MTRAQTLAGYAVIALAVMGYQWAARRRRPAATLGRVIAWLAIWPPTSWLLLAAWLWLGWHLFARVDRQ